MCEPENTNSVIISLDDKIRSYNTELSKHLVHTPFSKDTEDLLMKLKNTINRVLINIDKLERGFR